MKQASERRFRDERGQGMTEYILIVVFIAVASIALWKAFGNRIKALVAGSTQAITEQTGDIIDETGKYKGSESTGQGTPGGEATPGATGK